MVYGFGHWKIMGKKAFYRGWGLTEIECPQHPLRSHRVP